MIELRTKRLLIHLNGMPGVGKLTIARQLAKQLDAKLIDNHTLHNIPLSIHGRFGARWDLFYAIRQLAYDAIKTISLETPLVMTNALAHGSKYEEEAWEAVQKLASESRRHFVPILLVCEQDEHCRRVVTEERTNNHKLDSAEVVQDYYKEGLDIIHDDTLSYALTLDVSSLQPDEAAKMIIDHVRHCSA